MLVNFLCCLTLSLLIPLSRAQLTSTQKDISSSTDQPSVGVPHPLLSDPNFDPSILTDDAARIVQSSLCTSREREQRIQCFSILPQKQYAIPLGDTVDMQCTVLNQHGKVQWRAKKILLGYDRSIPGHPRYSIIGNVGRGEHVLQIRDVQLSDAGEYECQVTPVPANNHPLLRRKTELVVLVKPSMPQILYPDVPPPDNTLIISQPDPIVKITVLCLSIGGSPAPDFKWMLNGQLIKTKTSSRRREGNNDPMLKKLQPKIESQPEAGKSLLTIHKSGLADGDHLACSVSNAATKLHHDPFQHNLTSLVTIRVHTPPGEPKIISPNSNHIFLEGEELKAVCVASPPGNPPGGLFWRWLLQPTRVNRANAGPMGHYDSRVFNDYKSIDAYVQSLGQGGGISPHYHSESLDRNTPMVGTPNWLKDGRISEDVQPLHYRLSKETNQLVNTLTIPRINRRFHASRLICETGHQVGDAHQTSVDIYVKHPPDNVTISVEGESLREDYSNGRREMVIYAKAGEQKTLICRTGTYYNQADIKWISQSPRRPSSSPKELIGKTNLMQSPVGETYYQESRIDVSILEEDDHGYIDCHVWSEGDTRIDARVRLDIIHPPEKPTIIGYRSMQPIKVSHLIELTCTSKGGNPLPTLRWVKDKEPVETDYKVKVFGRQSSLKLKLNPQKIDNGAQYHCVAVNSATDSSGVVSDPVILSVIFPPQRVTISFQGHSVIEQGNQLVINCLAASSNPPAVIRWRHYQCGPAHATDQSIIVSSGRSVAKKSKGRKCQSVDLKGSDETVTPGEFGGEQAHSRLWLRPTWKYHLDYIECRAKNEKYGLPNWDERLQLNVTFPPQFIGLQAGKEKVIREGQTIQLDLGPYANPPVTSVAWQHQGRLIPPDPGSESSALQGPYSTGPMNSLLAFHKISRHQMGNYTVVAGNDIQDSREDFFVNVTYPPELIGANVENYTIAEHDNLVHLACAAEANPALADRAFTWYKFAPPEVWPEDAHEAEFERGQPIRCTDEFSSLQLEDDPVEIEPKLEASCKQDGALAISSQLTIRRLTQDDTGTYECLVDNGLGESAVKRINLLYYFAPMMIQLPRYTKAAGEQGTSVNLTCYIRTEPRPQVGWFKDGRVIEPSKATANSNKYVPDFVNIRPGLYRARLQLNALQKQDFGVYHCHAVNIKGEAKLEIKLAGTSTPDVPLNIRLLNATLDTLHVAWTQGFDGGMLQSFQVKWNEQNSTKLAQYGDVGANDNRNAVDYIISGLKSGTTYAVSVRSRNAKHGFSEFSDKIQMRTDVYDPFADGTYVPSISVGGQTDHQNALFIIVAACIFGLVVLIINLVVVTLLVKRRRARQMATVMRHTSKLPVATDVNSGLTMSNGYASHRGKDGDPTANWSGSMPMTSMMTTNDVSGNGQLSTTTTTGFSEASDESNGSCSCCGPSNGRSRTHDVASDYVKVNSFDGFNRVNGTIRDRSLNQPYNPSVYVNQDSMSQLPQTLTYTPSSLSFQGADFAHFASNPNAVGGQFNQTYRNAPEGGGQLSFEAPVLNVATTFQPNSATMGNQIMNGMTGVNRFDTYLGQPRSSGCNIYSPHYYMRSARSAVGRQFSPPDRLDQFNNQVLSAKNIDMSSSVTLDRVPRQSRLSNIPHQQHHQHSRQFVNQGFATLGRPMNLCQSRQSLNRAFDDTWVDLYKHRIDNLPKQQADHYEAGKCQYCSSRLLNQQQPTCVQATINGDEDASSDRRRYSDELRRVQYGSGTAAQIMFGSSQPLNSQTSTNYRPVVNTRPSYVQSPPGRRFTPHSSNARIQKRSHGHPSYLGSSHRLGSRSTLTNSLIDLSTQDCPDCVV